MHSSTTARSSARCRSVSSIGAVFAISAGILGEEVSRHRVAEQPARRSQRQVTGARWSMRGGIRRNSPDETEPLQPAERAHIDLGDVRDDLTRPVTYKAEQHPV